MPTATTILYCIAGVLGVWSSSILCVWTLRRLERRARRTPGQSTIVPAITTGQRRMGVGLAIVCLFAAAAVLWWAEALRLSGGGDSMFIISRLGTGIFLILAGGAAFAALRFDASHGRRRCPRCWYDLVATTGRKCPECGHEAKADRALFKTRRRLRLLWASAFLVCGAYVSNTAPLMGTYGIRAAIPTTGLIVALPWLPDDLVSTGAGSFEDRLSNGDLAQWQYSLLSWRCRSIVQSSADLDAIVFALDHLPSGEALPKLGRRAQKTIIVAACENKLPTGFRQWHVFELLPQPLDARMSSEALSLVQTALESGDQQRALFGMWVAMRMGVVAEPCIPSVVRIIEDPASSQMSVLTAAGTLNELVSTSKIARDAIISLFASDQEAARGAACLLLPNPLMPEVRPLVEAALADQSDLVAGRAAIGLIRFFPTGCEVLPLLKSSIETRPKAAAVCIWTLAHACRDPAVVELVARMLKSDDPKIRENAAIAAEQLGAAGATLAASLEFMATDPLEAPSGQAAAAQSLDAIRFAAREATSPPRE